MGEYKYEIVKFTDDNIELDVNIDPYSETIWLTQAQMEELFDGLEPHTRLGSYA